MSSSRVPRRDFSSTRLEHAQRSRENRLGQAFGQSITVSVDLDRAENLTEVKHALVKAFNQLVVEVNSRLNIISRYINEDGKLVRGGLAAEAIDGQALSEAIVDEFQTMGSSLTDQQWKDLE